MKIEALINGIRKELEFGCGEFLADTLRRYGYLSIRKGCDTGNCGLCTLWIEEKPILSCSTPTARIEGKRVTTIEGVDEEAKEFATFLVNEGAEQCGFCSPGFIMTVLAMKRELNQPTREDILHYLAGNLCRCTGYEGQLRAIQKYMEVHGK